MLEVMKELQNYSPKVKDRPGDDNSVCFSIRAGRVDSFHGPDFSFFAAQFHRQDTQLSPLTGTCVLALGYSNILGRGLTKSSSLPLGSRYLYLASFGESHWSFLPARAVNGVATATNETALVQVVTDMLSLHEKGVRTGVYL
jgi:hypothetical protein